MTLHIKRFESSLFRDTYHEIAINCNVPFVDKPQLIRSSCLISATRRGQLTSCSPVSYRYKTDNGRVRAEYLDLTIELRDLRWSNGVKYKFSKELYEASIIVNNFAFEVGLPTSTGSDLPKQLLIMHPFKSLVSTQDHIGEWLTAFESWCNQQGVDKLAEISKYLGDQRESTIWIWMMKLSLTGRN